MDVSDDFYQSQVFPGCARFLRYYARWDYVPSQRLSGRDIFLGYSKIKAFRWGFEVSETFGRLRAPFNTGSISVCRSAGVGSAFKNTSVLDHRCGLFKSSCIPCYGVHAYVWTVLGRVRSVIRSS